MNIYTLPLFLFSSFLKTFQRQLVIILISVLFTFWRHKDPLSHSEFISRKSKGWYKNTNSVPFPELSSVLDQQTCFHLPSTQKRNELNWWCLHPAVFSVSVLYIWLFTNKYWMFDLKEKFLAANMPFLDCSEKSPASYHDETIAR